MNKKRRRDEVVAEYLAGVGSYRELGARHGIGYTTIRSWVKSAQSGSRNIEIRKKEEVRKGGAGHAERAEKKAWGEESLEERDAGLEVRRLREELRKSEMHNKLLNAMIDIAEEQLGVQIRKKRGTRQ